MKMSRLGTKRVYGWLVACAAAAVVLGTLGLANAAPGGDKAVQISVVGMDGKALVDAQVDVSLYGGKPLNAFRADKGTWVLKSAPDKLTIRVRSGHVGGTVDVSIPAGLAEANIVVTVDGRNVRAEVVSDAVTTPQAPPKPDLSGIDRSLQTNFDSALQSARPAKGLPPARSNASVKDLFHLAPPANDNCVDGAPVGALPASVAGTTVDATDDIVSGQSCGVSSGPFKNVWYTVVGTGETITVSTCNAATAVSDTKISVFCNDCGDKICVGGNDDASGPSCTFGSFKSRFSFCSELGRTYLITVGGFSATTATGAIQLDVTSSGTSCATPPVCQRPANDQCAGATPVGALPASVVSSNAGAASNVATSCGVSTGPFREIWFSVVGNGQTLTASTCNAGTVNGTGNFDTKLSVFCSDCALPTCVGGNDDAVPACATGSFKSTFSWCSEAGRTYFIAVGGFSATTAVGTIQLDVTANGTTCATAPNCGPPISNCPGETCASAALISAVPFNGTGNTCDCLNDYDSACPYTGSTSKDTVYRYTPSADQCVDISLCNGSAYDTKVYVYQGSCAGTAIACNDDACSSPNYSGGAYVSRLTGLNLLAGQTYYIVVDGYGGECGDYVLDVTPCGGPCVTCPGGAVAENEANCGIPTDTTNGGCNSSPTVFSPIACGQDVCGTAAWDGTNRDTDWYQITVAAPTEFTWTVTAGFDFVIGLVKTSPAGNPDCATATALDPFAVGASCDTTGVVSACLPPGTYWWFVAPDFNGATFACGGQYTARLDCVGCTPPTCTGDTCATAQVVPSVPYNDTGDTCICGDDYDEICPFDAAGSADRVYAYTPAQDECVSISLCNGSDYDTKVYVYENSCGAYQSGTAIACNDDDCTSPNFPDPFVSFLDSVNLTAGNTYYIVVDGYDGECGNYVLDIGPCAPPCDVTCGSGATAEGEANCGIPDDPINGGCNTDTVNPPTSPVACGQEYCGTAAFDGSLRDTDWYEVVVATPTRFTWTVNGEFNSLVGLIETIPAGSADCADGTGFIEPAGFPTECTPGSVVTECLPAGTYRFFVAPTFDDPVTCGAEYSARLDCEACTIPLGACCRADGSCDPDVAEAQCAAPDTWQGEGIQCINVSCPQPPPNDLCDDAIAVAVPSVTAGSTDLSTLDSGFPTPCGTSVTTAGVWYVVTGTGNTITVDLCNGATSYDSKISVYCPDCATPACVGGNDDSCGLQSSVSWCSQSGQAYYVLVHGFGGQTGPFELTVSDDGTGCANPASCVVTGPCGSAGDCCTAHATPGCEDEDCCNLVCGCDSFCCDVEWDINCAEDNIFVPGCSAADLCDICGSAPLTGGCCLSQGCAILSAADCSTQGGQYLGDGTSCSGPGAGNPTVFVSDPNVAIPDAGGPANPATDTIIVPNSIIIGDVNVDLIVAHTWVGDLIVEIEHNGTTVVIVDRPGFAGTGFGCNSNDLDVIVDDEGSGGPIEALCGPSDNDLTPTSPPNYGPNNPLSAFDGMDAAGAWIIRVSDNASFDTGSLIHWSLHIDEPGPSPCVVTGACCTSNTACQVATAEDCATAGGVYLGDFTTCSASGPVTVYDADPALAIPDAGGPANPAMHMINVPDSYTLSDVEIDLVVTHTWVGDLIVEVEHNGTTAILVDRMGFTGTGFGCNSNDLNVVIDDQGAGGAIESLCGTGDNNPTPTSPPNYVPNNPLSVFNGMDSAGAWIIRVSDNASFDTGTLDHWSLHLHRPGASPCEGTFPVCGNGVVETGEECDDGNSDNTDGCVEGCLNATCGDGYVQAGVEQCDDGNTNDNDACSNNCTQGCGNGIVNTGEECDDGNASNTDACTNACTNARCGDGFTQAGEQCDDGNANDNDACSNNCTQGCGNGIVNTGEECDDGNAIDEDGCTNSCTLPFCGDGIVQAGEECDGLNNAACDGEECLADCTCTPPPPTDIPTMSEWGLVVLTLLLLTGAKVYFGRRSAVA